ncbi:MAG: 1-deoxy-D-xylulose-5-phosphate reductoisomerase, partial [Lentisphaeria bacterium]|nr:1-deoxy-D-xylulose-5-phosphate reductoisomerase [Lentisphaeria bacterium]
MTDGKKNTVILGSTGSVGMNACKVAEALKDRINVVGVAANCNAELL